MKRDPLNLIAIADPENVAVAFHLAARGKQGHPEVIDYRRKLSANLWELSEQLASGQWQARPMRVFQIRDPKVRTIHAPVFRDRVAHHAIMAQVGPVLDRALVFDSYACRLGKGTLAAVQRAQHHAGRFAWYGQIDIRSYFASIRHDVLLVQLARKFRDADVWQLLERVVTGFETEPGRGLPIGTLPSQHFANFHLHALDRLLLERSGVGGYVRYMDDLVWWHDDPAVVRSADRAARDYLATALGLEAKLPVRLGQSRFGLSFCGFRVLPDRLLLSRRRKRRYAELRADAERDWLEGEIGSLTLQARYASALALTVHADALGWRREQLRRVPVAAALDWA
jgi:RNA-directed DNA polymerase